jgi:uncharacterized protein YkwD
VLPVLAAAFALHGPTASADPPTCAPGAADRAAVVCEINAARAAAGRGPVHSRASLADAAVAHSSDMVGRHFFAHESPEGDGPADRARRAGYMRHARTWRIGEVLVWTRGRTLTAAHAVDLWLESPTHRRIMLSPHYRDVGAGLVAGAPLGDPSLEPATTLTVVFGRRR